LYFKRYTYNSNNNASETEECKKKTTQKQFLFFQLEYELNISTKSDIALSSKFLGVTAAQFFLVHGQELNALWVRTPKVPNSITLSD
jgi:hypothetical protein